MTDLMSLENLSRRELQVLAKQHGIKANLKNADIIKQVSLARRAASAAEGVAQAVGECGQAGAADMQDREAGVANARPATNAELLLVEVVEAVEQKYGNGAAKECCASPATPTAVTIPSHLDLRLESSKVITEIHTEEKRWIDSAKKEMIHLEHCWDQVINSPIRKYGCPSSSDKNKTSRSLLSSGFTSIGTPGPLRKFRRRERGSHHEDITMDDCTKSSGQKQQQPLDCSSGNAENEERRVEQKAKQGRKSMKAKEKENRLGIKSRLSKSSKPQVKKSRRMALAEEKFKSRLLKRKN